MITFKGEILIIVSPQTSLHVKNFMLIFLPKYENYDISFTNMGIGVPIDGTKNYPKQTSFWLVLLGHRCRSGHLGCQPDHFPFQRIR